jgi:ribosomal RNA-processing protein 36
MPRRPRPADRPPPKSKSDPALPSLPTKSLKVLFKQPRLKYAEAEPESEESEIDGSGDSRQSGMDAASTPSDSEPNYEQDIEDIDVDAPRVAQWEPDEFDSDIDASEEEDESKDDDGGTHPGPSDVQLVRPPPVLIEIVLVSYSS